MEHAPLRPVPSRRSGPVDPATATREVAAALPGLSALDARALALVALSERPRAEVAGTLGIEEAELGRALTRARKELRRTVAVLGGSGWCERAEALISDRLDGALTVTDERCLDVHLRNCPRCVEHERRLVQATDWLLAGVPGGAPAAGPTTAPPMALPTEEAPTEEAPTEAPSADAAPTAAAPTDAARTDAAATDAAATDAAPTDASPSTAAPKEIAPAAAPGPGSQEIAAAAEVLVAVRTRRQIAAAVVWNSAVALAVLLTLATIALTIAGILGAEL